MTDQAPVQIMAILNVTPDSFSDGGWLHTLDEVLRAADTALNAGASILDVGGESTRPGAIAVPADEERKRVVPVVEALCARFPDALISVDTRKAAVADAALSVGARMVNDVSGLQYDAAMAATVARHQAWLVLMHSQGTPETMQRNPTYPAGIVAEVYRFFERQIDVAVAAGVRRDRLILDPGFGFGKNLAHNLALLARFEAFQDLGLPLLAGLSRKSFLTLGRADIPATQREPLTAAAMALAIRQGARYVRVHDVAAQAPAVRLIEAALSADISMEAVL